MPDDNTPTLTIVELAADHVVATSGLNLDEEGPPYRVRFLVKHGPKWPAVKLLLTIADEPVAVIGTTEPRLAAALRELLEGLGS